MKAYEFTQGKKTMSLKVSTAVRDREGQLQKRGISTKNNFLAQMIESLMTDPVRAAHNLRQDLRQAARSHDDTKYIIIAAVFEWALNLDDEAWAEFVADEFWRGHSRLRYRNRLRYCLMYVYGSHKNTVIANQARDHARAIQDFFDGFFTPEQVLSALREGGLSAAKQARKPKPKAHDGWMRGSYQVRGAAAEKLKSFGDGQTLIFRGMIALRNGRHTITFDDVVIKASDPVSPRSNLHRPGSHSRNTNSERAPLRPQPAPIGRPARISR